MGITRDHATTFTRVSLPIGQMYHVAVDDRVPYWIYGNRQDDGTMRGPSNSPVAVTNVPSYAPRRPAGRGGFGGGRGAGGGDRWEPRLGGCESGFTLPVPGNPDVVWASCYGNEVTRFDARLGRARSVSPWIHTLDSEPNKTKYRCHWTPPLAIDPFETETVYYGCQVIFRTSDGGQTWNVISPDLSTQDASRIVSSGGVIGDNLGQFYGEVVFAIAPSKIRKGLIWAGTNDGKVWYTRDGGATWADVTKNVGMPAWGTVSTIEPSRFDAGTAYLAVDFHLMDDRDPYIYKTTDFGETWTRISDGLPKGHPLAYVKSVAENPNRQGMLFAGTGHAFYYSLDDGASWTQFKEGLPAAPVTWIEIEPRYHDVVVSTYGRGLYMLRDITRLEQSDLVTDLDAAFLYAPRPGFREPNGGSAEFLYSLKTASPERVKVEILDQSDTVVRTLGGSGRAGVSRVVWDLRYEPPVQVELRTRAPDNPHIWDEPRFKGHETRPVVHWGIQGAVRNGPLAAPGSYRVRMTVAGRTFTETFDVLKAPQIPSSQSDLEASTRTQIRLRDDMNAAAGMINRIEVMRKQIEDQLATNTGNDEIEQALGALDTRMMDVEVQLLSRTMMHSDDKWYVEAYKVYMNLVWLNGVVGTGAGDVQGGADYRPTDASLEVLAMIEKDLASAKADFTTLIDKDVPAFNRAHGARGVTIKTGGF